MLSKLIACRYLHPLKPLHPLHPLNEADYCLTVQLIEGLALQGLLLQRSHMELSDDLEQLAKQESALVLPQFDENVAWLLGVRIRELATSRSSPILIEIKGLGRQLFCCALTGSTPDNAEWIRRKSNTAARFHKSSYAIGLRLRQTNSTLAEKHELSPMDYAAHGGSFPLKVSTAGFVGTVTVSGLPQRDDHELVVEALCGHLGRDYREFALKRSPDSN